MSLEDIRRAIADEKAGIAAAQAALAEAREALKRAEVVEHDTVVKSTLKIRALEAIAETYTAEDKAPRLHSVEHRSTVKRKMETLTDTHRLNISAGRSAPDDKKADPFLAHIRNPKNDKLHGKGYTLRSLALALGVSASMLSMNRRTHACPQARADKVKDLTGWPADRKHWPAGILS